MILLLALGTLVTAQKDVKPLFPPPGGGKDHMSGHAHKQNFLPMPPMTSIDVQGGLGGGLSGSGFAGIGGQQAITGNLVPMERITKHTRTTEHHFGGHDDKKHHQHIKGKFNCDTILYHLMISFMDGSVDGLLNTRTATMWVFFFFFRYDVALEIKLSKPCAAFP